MPQNKAQSTHFSYIRRLFPVSLHEIKNRKHRIERQFYNLWNPIRRQNKHYLLESTTATIKQRYKETYTFMYIYKHIAVF